VSKESIRGLLSTPVPEGVAMQHYSSGLGTIWSMIFDITAGTVDVCFGGPSSPRNRWRTFGLHDTAGTTDYPAVLPNQPAPPGLWVRMPPRNDPACDGK